MSAQTLEVHLEELGAHAWAKAPFNTLSSSVGSAQFRFVARPSGEHLRESDDLLVGATFPVTRLQDLDDQTEPNAWLDLARDRLCELDEQLVKADWRWETRNRPALVVADLHRTRPPGGSLRQQPLDQRNVLNQGLGRRGTAAAPAHMHAVAPSRSARPGADSIDSTRDPTASRWAV
jgi:hypothetical protein